jgi:hypothetical protein
MKMRSTITKEWNVVAAYEKIEEQKEYHITDLNKFMILRYDDSGDINDGFLHTM